MPIRRSTHVVLASALVFAALVPVVACDDKTSTPAPPVSSNNANSGGPLASPSTMRSLGVPIASGSAASSAAASSSANAVASALAGASAAPSASAVASGSASAIASAAPSGSASAGACGKKPLPDCPLQGWMKANTSAAMQSQDFAQLEKALTQTANFAPAGYTNWVSISKDGAKAAHDQSLDGVKASCRGCHNQYQKKYRAEMRDRKI